LYSTGLACGTPFDMKVIYGIENISKDFKNNVVTIGAFDGVHIGHQNILNKTKIQTNFLGVSDVVITFDPHPGKLLSSKRTPLILTNLNHKLKLFSDYSVEKCLIIKTEQDIFNMSAIDFVEDILYKRLKVKQIVVGENFTFGKNRQGNIELLTKLGEKYNFGVISVKLRKTNSDIISSSLIRELVSRAKLKKAENMLGRNFSILGKLTKDKLLIKKIGLPFFKLVYTQEIFPMEGLYKIKINSNEGIAIVKIYNVVIEDTKLNLLNKKDKKDKIVCLFRRTIKQEFLKNPIELKFIKFISKKIKFNEIKHYLSILKTNHI